jgi:hypothetical protein
MTQGRMRNGRYQQGIGVPETLGVQPTTWSEPKPPAVSQVKFDSPNVSLNRDYGSTPDYVDGRKSRWEVPANAGNLIKGVASLKQGMSDRRKRREFDEESASRLGISTEELRARRRASARESGFDSDADAFSRTSAAGWTP